MALLAPLWLQNLTAGFPASGDRALIDATFFEGAFHPGDLAVSQRGSGANMSVDVAAGECVVQGDDVSAQGKYLCNANAVTNVTISAAPGTGSSRIDLVIAQVRDSEAIGGSNNDWQIVAVTGTAGSSPVAPAVPASALLLAQVAVGSGVVTITSANITDQRSFARPVSLVSALPAVANPGQIVSVAGTDKPYIGDSDQGWVPLVRGDLMQRAIALMPDEDISGPGALAWGAINFAQPKGLVNISALVTGQMASAVSGATYAQLFVKISQDAGATWIYNGPAPGAASPNGFAPVTLTAHGMITLTPTGPVQIQAALYVNSGGDARMFQGSMTASIEQA